MSDPRIDNLARILVGYSTKVTEGDTCLIEGPSGGRAADRGGLRGGAGGRRAAGPRARVRRSAGRVLQVRVGRPARVDLAALARWGAEEADCRIAIWADTNTRELSNVPPERQTMRRSATRELLQTMMQRSAEGEHRWVGTMYPTNAHAADAEMSLADFEDFYYRACLADDDDPLGAWKRASAECHRLAEWIEGREEVRIVAEGTDIAARDRRAPLHPLRRRAQHARRRVLHRADRGLGRGRGHVPPAGDDRRPRGRRGAAAASRAARWSTRAPSAARST